MKKHPKSRFRLGLLQIFPHTSDLESDPQFCLKNQLLHLGKFQELDKGGYQKIGKTKISKITFFSENIFRQYFLKIGVMKNKLQTFFRDNFFVFKYFLLNPKAREALAPCRSNAPSTIQIRQKLAKLS